MYVCMYVCMYVKCMDVWMYGCMDVWMDGWMYDIVLSIEVVGHKWKKKMYAVYVCVCLFKYIAMSVSPVCPSVCLSVCLSISSVIQVLAITRILQTF